METHCGILGTPETAQAHNMREPVGNTNAQEQLLCTFVQVWIHGHVGASDPSNWQVTGVEWSPPT